MHFGTNILDKHKIIALTKIRLGSHNFLIERGRWQRPKLDIVRRTCNICDSIEDEYHVIIECPTYIDIRQRLLDNSLLSHSIDRFLYDFYIKNSRVTFLDISSDFECKNDIVFYFSLYFFCDVTHSV